MTQLLRPRSLPRSLLLGVSCLLAGLMGCSGPDVGDGVDDNADGGLDEQTTRKKHDMRSAHDMRVGSPDLRPDLRGPGGPLRFAVFGDTRPASSSPSSPYPSSVVESIFRSIDRQAVQFVVVGGDYIYVSGTNAAEASRQMDLFLTARGQLSPMTPVHYILGNHEDKNIPTFQSKLSPQVYWSFQQGDAKFVGIANDAWDATQHTWLDTQLSVSTKYTFVFRHQYWGSHGVNATTDAEIKGLVDAHPFTLFVAGHDHSYKHKPALTRSEQRDVVAGNGGAPFDGGFTWYGYILCEEQPDSSIKVTAYKVEPGMDVPPVAMDTWSVTP